MPIDRRSIPEISKETVEKTIRKILVFSENARKEGLLALEDSVDKDLLQDRNNLFEYGISFVIDGTDYTLIEKILRNIQSLKEQSYTQKIIDNICIEGVLAIQRGDHPNYILRLLDSLVPEQSRSDWLKNEIKNNLIG